MPFRSCIRPGHHCSEASKAPTPAACSIPVPRRAPPSLLQRCHAPLLLCSSELPALPEQQDQLQPGVRDSAVPGHHVRQHHGRSWAAGALHQRGQRGPCHPDPGDPHRVLPGPLPREPGELSERRMAAWTWGRMEQAGQETDRGPWSCHDSEGAQAPCHPPPLPPARPAS